MDKQVDRYENGGGYPGGNRGNMPGGNGNRNSGNGGNEPPKKPSVMMIILVALSTLMIVYVMWTWMFGSTSSGEEVSYTQFLES